MQKLGRIIAIIGLIGFVVVIFIAILLGMWMMFTTGGIFSKLFAVAVCFLLGMYIGYFLSEFT
jgi:hypothetical protein